MLFRDYNISVILSAVVRDKNNHGNKRLLWKNNNFSLIAINIIPKLSKGWMRKLVGS